MADTQDDKIINDSLNSQNLVNETKECASILKVNSIIQDAKSSDSSKINSEKTNGEDTAKDIKSSIADKTERNLTSEKQGDLTSNSVDNDSSIVTSESSNKLNHSSYNLNCEGENSLPKSVENNISQNYVENDEKTIENNINNESSTHKEKEMVMEVENSENDILSTNEINNSGSENIDKLDCPPSVLNNASEDKNNTDCSVSCVNETSEISSAEKHEKSLKDEISKENNSEQLDNSNFESTEKPSDTHTNDSASNAENDKVLAKDSPSDDKYESMEIDALADNSGVNINKDESMKVDTPAGNSGMNTKNDEIIELDTSGDNSHLNDKKDESMEVDSPADNSDGNIKDDKSASSHTDQCVQNDKTEKLGSDISVNDKMDKTNASNYCEPTKDILSEDNEPAKDISEDNEPAKDISEDNEPAKDISEDNSDKNNGDSNVEKSIKDTATEDGSSENNNDIANAQKEKTKTNDADVQTIEEISKDLELNDDSSKEKEGTKIIKLRSFESLCGENDAQNEKSKLLGVSFGDILKHGSIVESDDSGGMHLKISSVVGGEDSITGIEENTVSGLQISSVASLIESDKSESSKESSVRIPNCESVSESTIDKTVSNKETVLVSILGCDSQLKKKCMACLKINSTKYRIKYQPPKEHAANAYLCSTVCKDKYSSILPENHILAKPSQLFERYCIMCNKEISLDKNENILNWQTKDFCNKLCLADHIGNVARNCFHCGNSVRVLYMVKYCVRFGSDVHQFCSNKCLEQYKRKIEVCCYCQINLSTVSKKVVSASNKVYCSIKCQNRAQRKDIGQINYKEVSQCTVCQEDKVNQFKFITKNSEVWLCSDPCLSVYKYANHVKAVNCCLCARFVDAEDYHSYFYNNNELRVFCSNSCLSVFVISYRYIVACNYCKVKKYNFDMIHKMKNDTFYCSLCCFNLQEGLKKVDVQSKPVKEKEEAKAEKEKEKENEKPIEPKKSEPVVKECYNCHKSSPTQFHMVMSDSSLRSFCSFGCASTYKTKYGYKVTESPAVPLPIPKTSAVTKRVSSPAPKPIHAEKTKNTVDFAAIEQMGKTRDEKLKDAKSITTLLSILQKLEYPDVANKATSCKPPEVKPPKTDSKETNTDETNDPKFIPVPYPVFVPQPMMMYTAKVPIPLIIPLPVPIPVFLPTTEKTTSDIVKSMTSIQDLIPTDTLQAEMLMLAKGHSEEVDKDESPEQQSNQETVEMPEISLEEPNEILTFEDDQTQQELNSLNELIVKFSCEDFQAPGPTRKSKRHNSADTPSKRRKTDYNEEESSVYSLNSSYGIAVWVEWVKKKSSELGSKLKSYLIDENIVNLSPQAINESLSMFISELALEKNYEIDTLFYILLGIQKDLFEKGSTVCIFLEEKFEKFTVCFDRVIDNYMRQKFDADILAFEMLGGSRVTEDILWQARQLGAHTPYVLLNTMFYFSTKAYKLATLQDHKDISFSQVIKQWRRKSTSGDSSYTRTTLLKYFPRSGTEGGSFASESQAIEMLENKEDPLKCPVKLYQFYLSKCPLSVQNNQNLYYVYPESCCLPDSPVWFTTKAVNDDTLQRMLNRVLLVKEIQEALFH